MACPANIARAALGAAPGLAELRRSGRASLASPSLRPGNSRPVAGALLPPSRGSAASRAIRGLASRPAADSWLGFNARARGLQGGGVVRLPPCRHGSEGFSGEGHVGEGGGVGAMAMQPIQQDLWTRVQEPWEVDKEKVENDGRERNDEDEPHLPPFQALDENLFTIANSASLVHRAFYALVRIEPTGAASRLSMRRRDLLRSTGLVPRDLRRLDPSLNVKSPPSLVVRDKVILCNMGGVRAVITRDACLLFEPDSKSAKKFLTFLSARLINSAGQAGKERLALDLSMQDELTLKSLDVVKSLDVGHEPAPFELEAIEAALVVATARLDKLVLRLKDRTDHLVRVLPGKRITSEGLEELRRMKQALVELESNAESVRDVLLELLDDRNDLAVMCMTARREHSSRIAQITDDDDEATRGFIDADLNDHLDDAEDLLEYYYQRCESVQSEAENLLADARDLEESIGLSLSNRRYEVNRLELTLSVASFVAAVGAMIAGIFGMNLQSTLEMSITGFWGVTALIVFGGVAMFWWIMRIMKKKKIL